MRVGVLGAAEARLDGVALDLGTRKQRAVLAALALHRGRVVQPDALVDLLWGEAPPTAVTATLQGYVARLRRALEPGRAPRAEAQVLVTRGGGYVLEVADDDVDAQSFESTVSSAHALLGDGLVVSGAPAHRLEQVHADLGAGLALWRGAPYAELEDAPDAAAERARLEELRVVALEDRAVAALALGRHATVAGELESLTARHPLRERLWALRALALTRSGRQAEALDALRQVRELLDEELGLEPGPELRELQTAVLRQDPSLEWRGQSASTVTRPAAPTYGWPLVGRDDELAALVGLLDRSTQQPQFAALTGEPGIGKSRLCAELADAARAEGAVVLVGRCSQDEGAPPLYAWASVLGELGHDLRSVADDASEDGAARFRAWEAIVETVLGEAAARHVVVLLDDLHWADTSTLRVLRLLAERAETGRLLVVATWRDAPAPVGQLAVVAEMFARRHALRLRLAGLTEEGAREIVTSVAAATPTAAEAGALRRRTDGNPFFLVEYARLARDGGDLAGLLAEEDPPAGVQDVLVRRLATLPEDSLSTLRHASVLGREFDVPTLAAVIAAAEEDVLDSLDAPLAMGLVRESGVDRFRFAHALVRDTAYAGLPQSRRGRRHARAAEVLDGVRGRESEVARHWLAAGPQHAGRAWRAARTAASAAREFFAYDEAAELLTGALDALESDPGTTDEDRYEVLLDLARAQLAADNLVAMRTTVLQAVRVAGRLDDLSRQLTATSLLTVSALWQTGSFGAVDREVVALLRAGLERLPAGDGAERCLAMVGLANELYYTATVQERQALCEQAVAMARRLGDPRLLLHVLLASPMCIWSPATAGERLALTAEAVELARDLGDPSALCIGMALHASAASELGQVVGLLELVEEARQQARAHRQQFSLLFLDGLEIPWRAMRDEFDRVRELAAEMSVIHDRIDVAQSGDALVGAQVMEMLWLGQAAELAQLVGQVEGVTVMPIAGSAAALLGRAGHLDAARARLRRGDLELSPDWWFSTMELAMAAEAALRTGLADVAARAYAGLVPFRGHPAAAGSGTVVGPVDAFLAMAALATGERTLAAEHAADAERLCAEWGIPLAARWFGRVRQEFSF